MCSFRLICRTEASKSGQVVGGVPGEGTLQVFQGGSYVLYKSSSVGVC